MGTSTGGDTATAILDAAERMVQTRGFNGFSYADVAAELGLTKPALHYHFPGKVDLGQALVARYADRLDETLKRIDTTLDDPPARLRAFANTYLDVLRHGRMCLCGMLAAEIDTLPEPLRPLVLDFFLTSETWLAGVLEEGARQGSLAFRGPATDVARALVASLEGALLIARLHDEPARFEAASDRLLGELAPGGRSVL